MVADMFGFPFRIVSTQEVAVVFRSDCGGAPLQVRPAQVRSSGMGKRSACDGHDTRGPADNSRGSPHVLFIDASGIKKAFPCEPLHASNSACAITRGRPSTLALRRCVMKAVIALLVLSRHRRLRCNSRGCQRRASRSPVDLQAILDPRSRSAVRARPHGRLLRLQLERSRLPSVRLGHVRTLIARSCV
jgi:hypothetical protein